VLLSTLCAERMTRCHIQLIWLPVILLRNVHVGGSVSLYAYNMCLYTCLALIAFVLFFLCRFLRKIEDILNSDYAHQNKFVAASPSSLNAV
jgi:uncharacterized membrane protein